MLTILANGTCPTPPPNLRDRAERGEVTSLKVIIDGTQLIKAGTSSSILGTSSAFLPASCTFHITHFEPLDDGRCIVHYSSE